MKKFKIAGTLCFLLMAANLFYGGFQGFQWGYNTSSGEIARRYGLSHYSYSGVGSLYNQWMSANVRYQGVPVNFYYGFSGGYFYKGRIQFSPVTALIKNKVKRSLFRKYGTPVNNPNMRIFHPANDWTLNLEKDINNFNKYGEWQLPAKSTAKRAGTYVSPDNFYIWKLPDTIIIAEKTQFMKKGNSIDIYYLDRNLERYADRLIQAVKRMIVKQKDLKFDSLL